MIEGICLDVILLLKVRLDRGVSAPNHKQAMKLVDRPGSKIDPEISRAFPIP